MANKTELEKLKEENKKLKQELELAELRAENARLRKQISDENLRQYPPYGPYITWTDCTKLSDYATPSNVVLC
jgi:hypothetical protein